VLDNATFNEVFRKKMKKSKSNCFSSNIVIMSSSVTFNEAFGLFFFKFDYFLFNIVLVSHSFHIQSSLWGKKEMFLNAFV